MGIKALRAHDAASGVDPRPAQKSRNVVPARGYPSIVEDLFAAEFPAVLAFIKAVNAKDHSALIRLLQRLESWLVIELVAPKLVDRLPFVTLHDAIFCRVGDIAAVEAAFAETFDALGFRLALKAESWIHVDPAPAPPHTPTTDTSKAPLLHR